MKNSQNEKKKDKDKDKDKDKEKEQIKIPQLSYNFNISDIIVKYIIEKLISLTISQSLQNKIAKKINPFCFEQIKEALLLALYIDFINYDKDDVAHKRTLLEFISHSNKNILKAKNQKNLIKNKSEILRKYKFGTDLDPNIPFEGSINLDVFKTPKKEDKKDKNKDREKSSNKKFFLRFIKEEKNEEKDESNKDPNLGKLLNGLILRETYEKKDKNKNFLLLSKDSIKDSESSKEEKEPFVGDIEKINKFESHKLDFNHNLFNTKEENNILYCDVVQKSKNSWINIKQPKVPPIDRDAGTKINYIKNIIPKSKKNKNAANPDEDDIIKDMIKKEEITSSLKDPKKSFVSKKSKFLSYSTRSKKEQEDNNTRKKKYAPIIEFPSYDIDPKVLGGDTESEELKRLRENLEKELIEKKLEQARKLQKEREIQALEKAREEKRKELAHKNVTVDIKGEIIFIKSLNVNDFTNDFTKMRSKFKEIKTIQSISKNALLQKIIVEKNPVNLYEQIDKEKSKKKGKKNLPKSPRKDERQGGNKNLGLMDRIKEPVVASGSNFEIMNPECGVTLKENEKTKEGGKDFYSKYNKYSLEVYEETLNRTISSNFYSNQKNSIMTSNINNNNNTVVNKSLKKLKSKRIKDDAINEVKDDKNINNKNINLMVPNEVNNRIQVKAKNLKLALNDLDLIKERDEKYFSAKKKNKNIIKKNNIFSDYLAKKNRNKYDEINKFAKTLVGSGKWGDSLFPLKRPQGDFKKPQKPQSIELKRELPLNLLNHLPRKRLPPLEISNRMNNNELGLGMGYTMTDGFFKRKKKMRIFLSEENNKKEGEQDKNNLKNEEKENNKDKFSYTSASGFFQKQTDE